MRICSQVELNYSNPFKNRILISNKLLPSYQIPHHPLKKNQKLIMMKILMIIKEPLNKAIYNRRRFYNKSNKMNRKNKRTIIRIKNLFMIDLNHMRNKILMKKMKIRIIWIHKTNSMMMNLNNDIFIFIIGHLILF